MTEEKTTAQTSAADEPKKDRKKPERKPLWVCIPDGALYKIVKCATKADVGKVLTESGIDATNQEGVMILRARPIVPKIKQVMFRF